MFLALAVAATAAFPDAITVTATRFPVLLGESGVSVSILDRARLEQLQLPSLPDLLVLTPSVSLSRNGGAGGFTAVRIRGAEGEQTVVVVDGVRLSDAAAPGGGYDFAGLLNLNLERVEVLRGPQSLAWGSQAIGGVVAVTTREPGEALEVTGRAEGGSRSSALAAANASATSGRFAWSVGANYSRTDGISSASEARGATERDDHEGWGVNARLVADLGGGFSAEARGRTQSADFGVDGFPPPAFRLADTPERSNAFEASAYGGVRWRSSDGRFDQRVGYEDVTVKRETSDPRNAVPLNFQSTGRIQRVSWLGRFGLGDGLALDAGAEGEWSSLRTATPSSFDPDPEPSRAETSLWGLFGSVLWQPAEGLALSGGVRRDQHPDWGGAVTGAASLSFAPGNGPLRLKASFGEGFKAPSLFQLFSDFGNPDLQPERARGYDAGVELRLMDGRLLAGLAGFARNTTNQIDFVSCFASPLPICSERPFGTYDNIRRTRASGLEAELTLRPVDSLVAAIQVSLLDAENRTEGSPNFGNALPRRPSDQASATIDWTAPAGWSLGLTVRLVGDSFDDAGNFRRLPGHATADVRAAVPLGERWAIQGRVTNLTDANYETASFYGQPGRAFAVGVVARY